MAFGQSTKSTSSSGNKPRFVIEPIVPVTKKKRAPKAHKPAKTPKSPKSQNTQKPSSDKTDTSAVDQSSELKSLQPPQKLSGNSFYWMLRSGRKEIILTTEDGSRYYLHGMEHTEAYIPGLFTILSQIPDNWPKVKLA